MRTFCSSFYCLCFYICVQVTVPHVDEAYKLLNKSIIRVEQPDIHLEGEDEEAEPGAVIDEEDGLNTSHNDNSMDEDQPAEEGMETESLSDSHSISGSLRSNSQKKKLKLSYNEYKSMSTMILLYMSREEARTEEEGEESEGLKRSRIIEWYLNEIGDSIDTEEELIEKKQVVEKVIDRLIHRVSFFFS
jgi:DNA replication licensing factor MCM6